MLYQNSTVFYSSMLNEASPTSYEEELIGAYEETGGFTNVQNNGYEHLSHIPHDENPASLEIPFNNKPPKQPKYKYDNHKDIAQVIVKKITGDFTREEAAEILEKKTFTNLNEEQFKALAQIITIKESNNKVTSVLNDIKKFFIECISNKEFNFITDIFYYLGDDHFTKLRLIFQKHKSVYSFFSEALYFNDEAFLKFIKNQLLEMMESDENLIKNVKHYLTNKPSTFNNSRYYKNSKNLSLHNMLVANVIEKRLNFFKIFIIPQSNNPHEITLNECIYTVLKNKTKDKMHGNENLIPLVIEEICEKGNYETINYLIQILPNNIWTYKGDLTFFEKNRNENKFNNFAPYQLDDLISQIKPNASSHLANSASLYRNNSNQEQGQPLFLNNTILHKLTLFLKHATENKNKEEAFSESLQVLKNIHQSLQELKSYTKQNTDYLKKIYELSLLTPSSNVNAPITYYSNENVTNDFRKENEVLNPSVGSKRKHVENEESAEEKNFNNETEVETFRASKRTRKGPDRFSQKNWQ
ncbi:MAG: hypothetical protein J0H68_00895 [Sphingobacteriia bacterium]|nr:hypothetical protein [Sphingobacteriia bacterium]